MCCTVLLLYYYIETWQYSSKVFDKKVCLTNLIIRLSISDVLDFLIDVFRWCHFWIGRVALF